MLYVHKYRCRLACRCVEMRGLEVESSVSFQAENSILRVFAHFKGIFMRDKNAVCRETSYIYVLTLWSYVCWPFLGLFHCSWKYNLNCQQWYLKCIICINRSFCCFDNVRMMNNTKSENCPEQTSRSNTGWIHLAINPTHSHLMILTSQEDRLNLKFICMIWTLELLI